MPHWIVGQDAEPELRALYNRHYSARVYKDGRQPKQFVGPGQHIVLTLPGRSALFVWRKFINDAFILGDLKDKHEKVANRIVDAFAAFE